MYAGEVSWKSPQDNTVQVVQSPGSATTSLQELAASAPDHRNWKGIAISLLIISVVCGAILSCVVLLSPTSFRSRSVGRLITLDDLVKQKYKPDEFHLHWANDRFLVFFDDHGGISALDAVDNITFTLVENTTMIHHEFSRFEVSPDLQHILMAVSDHPHVCCLLAKYWVWPIKTGYMSPVVPAWSPQRGRPVSLQHASWLSDGRVLFIHDNNIYIRASFPLVHTEAITTTGRPGSLYHGVADPLYEEYILGSRLASWPSPDGRLLVYFTLNCSAVRNLHYTVYDRVGRAAVKSAKYPRAGERNPELTVTLAEISNTSDPSFRTLQPPAPLQDRDHYASDVVWLTSDQLSVTWHSRPQTSSHVTVYSAPEWKCQSPHVCCLLAKYWVWPIKTGYMSPVVPAWSPQRGRPVSLQHASWLSDGRVLFIHDNNIYIRASFPLVHTEAITTTGRPGSLYHGVADPLYEEYILGSRLASWPSPDGRLLVYFTLNCSAVRNLHYTVYDRVGRAAVKSAKYPRAGERNPELTVTLAEISNTSDPSFRTLQPPAPLQDRDHYASDVVWLTSDQLSVTWHSRPQTSSHVTVYSAPEWKCQSIYSWHTSHGGMRVMSDTSRGVVRVMSGAVLGGSDSTTPLLAVLVPEPPAPAADGSSPSDQIRLVDLKTGDSRALTRPPLNIHGIISYTNNSIYFVSSDAARPGELHLYRIGDDVRPQTATCLTCDLVMSSWGNETMQDDRCLWHQILSINAVQHNRVGFVCLGPTVPMTGQIELTSGRGHALAKGHGVREAVKSLMLPSVTVMSVTTSSACNVTIRVQIPPAYNYDESAAYPLVATLTTKASQVSQQWRIDWGSYVATEHAMVHVDVDLSGRVMPGESYGDILEIIEYLTSRIPYISPEHVVLLASGEGAWTLLSSLSKLQHLVNCTVAIAPIVSWRLHASAPSERLLGIPDENAAEYEAAELKATELLNTSLLLVHGLRDVRVPVQHSFLLARRLQQAAVLFRQMIYTDEGHDLLGVQEHLLRMLDAFISECM